MVNGNNETGYRKAKTLNVLAGLLIGGLAGAISMILLARQPGMKTRDQIWQGHVNLRDRMVDTFSDLERLTHYDNRKIPARFRAQTNFKSPKPL